MRPIKYRAWDVAEKKYYKDVQYSENCETNRFWDFNQVLEEAYDGKLILEQYTGLKDCKGNEIYEGDIVKYTDFDKYVNFLPVKWSSDMCAFETGASRIDYVVRRCEVVGNVHENPELLEAADDTRI